MRFRSVVVRRYWEGRLPRRPDSAVSGTAKVELGPPGLVSATVELGPPGLVFDTAKVELGPPVAVS